MVNLGVGIPTLVADLITPDHGIILHTENGMLGVGPAPEAGGAMDYPVNAGKQPVTALAGASYFDSAASFAMIRGGHVDVAIMGGLQVDEPANLANWAVPGKPLLGVGGAMDLATGARRLIITMTHADGKGRPKIVPQCTLPLTARRRSDGHHRPGRVRVCRRPVDADRIDARRDAGAGAVGDQRAICRGVSYCVSCLRSLVEAWFSKHRQRRSDGSTDTATTVPTAVHPCLAPIPTIPFSK